MEGLEDGSATSLLARVSKRAKFLNPRFSSMAVSGGGSRGASGDLPATGQAEGAESSSGGAAAHLLAASSGNSGAQETVLHNDDMLKILFSFLAVEDLCTSAIVSRQWNAISQVEEFWHTVSFQNRNIHSNQVTAVLNRHPGITSLNLVGLRPMSEQLLGTACTALPNLTKLELGKNPLNDQDLSIIGTRLHSLRHLRISDCNLGRFGPGEVVFSHDHLTKLEALGCCVTRLNVRCSRLEFLSLQDTSLSAFLPSCPHLNHLDLKGCSKIRDSELRAALIRIPTLTHLDLTSNLPLSDDSLREVANRCPALEHVILANCIAVSLASVRGFNAVRFLDLSNCDSLNSGAALPVLQSFTALEEVIMDSCSLIVNVSLTLPRLRMISLRGCRSLERVKLECRSLTELRLGRIEAGGPGCGALKHIWLASDAITSISWMAFPVLQTVFLRCPNLLELDVSDCDSLEDSIFASVGTGSSGNPARPAAWDLPGPSGSAAAAPAPGSVLQTIANLVDSDDLDNPMMLDNPPLIEILAEHPPAQPPPVPAPIQSSGLTPAVMACGMGCPRLRTLRLDCCEGLDKADLQSTSLTSLSLAGCKGLTSVKFNCPLLSNLRLDECDQIESVGISDVAVTSLSLGTCPSLGSLAITAARLSTLDLKGCGLLKQLVLQCPSLVSLDATFCSSLDDSALSGALKQMPPMNELILSVCTSLGTPGLCALGALTTLQRLDLSYTELEDLTPIAEICPFLQSLNISSCPFLNRNALDALMPRVCRDRNPRQLLAGSSSSSSSPAKSPALPSSLTELDVSYCHFPEAALSKLFAEGSALETLAASGCPGMKDGAWDGLNSMAEAGPGAPHALHTLALVGCKNLHTCILGLRRAAKISAGEGSTTWETQPNRLSGLVTLRIGLSSMQTLALELPRLTLLDANGCGGIRELELRCPLLLAGYFQACCSLTGRSLHVALSGCTQLEILDTQHMEVTQEELQALRKQCPPLRNLLYTHPSPSDT